MIPNPYLPDGNNRSIKADGDSIYASQSENLYGSLVPKLSEKNFKLPLWAPGLAGTTAWREAALAGLQRLNAMAIIYVGYVAKPMSMELSNALPKPVQAKAIGLDSAINLTLEGPLSGGATPQIGPVVKNEPNIQGTPSAAKQESKYAQGQQSPAISDKDREIQALRAKLDSIQEHLQNNSAVQQVTQLLNNFRLEQQQAKDLAAHQSAHPKGAQEMYVVRNQIKLHLSQQRKFVHPDTGVDEPAGFTKIRRFLDPIWRASFASYPEVIKGVVGADLLQMYINASSYEKPLAETQYADLNKAFALHEKNKQISFSDWETQFLLLLNEMTSVGHPKPAYEIKAALISAFKEDSRYKDQLRDVQRKTHLDHHAVLSIFRARASMLNDSASAAKNAANTANTESEEKRSRGRGNKNKNKRKKEQAANAALNKIQPASTTDGDTANAAASHRLCFEWIGTGDCTKDHCDFSHIQPHELAQRIKDAKANKSKSPVTANAAEGKTTSKSDCYHWLNGACQHGDSCHFKHDPKKRGMSKLEEEQEEGHAAGAHETPTHSLPTGIMPSISDITVPDELCAPGEQPSDFNWDQPTLAEKAMETESFESMWLQSLKERSSLVSTMLPDGTDAEPVLETPKPQLQTSKTEFVEQISPKILKTQGPLWENCDAWNANDQAEHCSTNHYNAGGESLFDSATTQPFKTLDVSIYFVFIFMFFGGLVDNLNVLKEFGQLVTFSCKAFLNGVCGNLARLFYRNSQSANNRNCADKRTGHLNSLSQLAILFSLFILLIGSSIAHETVTPYQAYMAGGGSKAEYSTGQEVVILNCLQCPSLVDGKCRVVKAIPLNKDLTVYSVSFNGTGRKLTLDECLTCEQGFPPQDLKPAKLAAVEAAMNVTSTSYHGRAIMDSGATTSFVNQLGLFVKGTVHDITPQPVSQAAGTAVMATKAGLVRLYANTPQYYGRYIQLTGLYTPSFTRSLVPASGLDEQGYYTTLGGNCTTIRKGPNGPILIKVSNEAVNNALTSAGNSPAASLYPLPDHLFRPGKPMCPDGDICKHDKSYACNSEAHAARTFNGDEHMFTLQHNKSHHCSMERIARMIEWDTGMAPPIPQTCKWCLACVVAKITDSPYKKMQQELVAHAVFDIVTADLVVNMPCVSLRGYKHYVNATDWKSGFVTGFLLKSRGEAAGYFLTFLKRGKTRHGKSPSRIIIDGGELKTKEIITFCGMDGTEIIINPAGQHPNAMAKAERVNRDTQEAERSYRQQGNAPPFLWEFATIAAWTSSNIIPSARAMRKGNVPKGETERQRKRPLTPLEMWEGRRAGSYAELRTNLITPFCEAVAFINKEDRSAHVMPGYRALYLCPAKTNMLTERTHFVLRLSDWKLMKARTVHANESVFPLRELRPSGIGEFKPYVTTSGGVGDISPTDDSLEDHPLMQYEEDADAEEVAPSVNKPTPENDGEDDAESDDKPPPLEPNDDLHTVIDVKTAMMDSAISQPRTLRSAVRSATHDALDDESESGSPDTDRRNYQGVINDGSTVMTKMGPATVTGRQGEDYLTVYQNDPEAIEYSLPSGRQSIWLPSERPGVIYNAQGLIVTPEGEHVANHVEYAQYVPLVHTPKHPLRYANARIEHHEANLAGHVFKGKSYDELLAEARTMTADEVDALIPKHYHQTLYHPLRPLIEKGEINEITGLIDIGVFGPPQECPQGYKPVDCMWVYKAKKSDEDSFFGKMKARCTMMGNQERHSIEKLAAYAPVMQQTALRAMLALYNGVAGVRFHTSDIKQAYVSTAMKRRVFVNMPPGYEVYVDEYNNMAARRLPPGKKQTDRKKRKVMLLLRALYGGMECGRLFWDSYIQFHEQLGFKKIHEDQCYLAMHKPNGDFIRILIHVDDSVIAQKGDALFQWYQDKLGERFEFVLGPLKRCLGIDYDIDYENGVIKMNQYDHVIKMLKAFNMHECKAEKHPMPRNVTLSEATVPTDPKEIDKYKRQFNMERAIGYFNWIAGGTRPDICLALKHLSRFAKAYGPEHIAAAKHLMRYLKGTARKCLIYRAGMEPRVQVFTDASHAGCPDTRRSITGVVIKYAGCTIFWLCLYQKIVSHSSCESELMALDKGATTGRFVRWLLEAMGAKRTKPTKIFVDNQGTIDIAINPVQAGRNKHVHARYFYVRDLVKSGEYVIVHLRTDEQVSDVLCANKGTARFDCLVNLLMDCAMTEIDEHGIPKWSVMYVAAPSV